MLADVSLFEVQVNGVMRWSKIRSFQKDMQAVKNSLVHGRVVSCYPAFISNDQNRIPPGLHSADYFGVNDRIIRGDIDTPDAVAFQGRFSRVMELVKFGAGRQEGKNLS